MSYDNAKIVLFSEIKNNIALKIKELDIFTRLKEGDKFGKYEEDNGSVVKETYFITEAGYLQRAIRLYYGQDRYKSCKYLETDFKCFAGDLDNLLICLESGSDYENVKKFTNNTISFINKIIPGLYSIKKTYPDYPDILARVDSIILVLIDFKTKSSKIMKMKLERHKLEQFNMCQSLESIHRLVMDNHDNKVRSNSFEY
jgi:hypothetical protein